MLPEQGHVGCQPEGDTYLNKPAAGVAFHIETSHLSCFANQMTGFYMKFNINLIVHWSFC